MHEPFFAGMDPGSDIEAQVNDTLGWAWYWDDGALYIVTGTDMVLGPETEMAEAMQVLLDSDDCPFGRDRLGEYLRIKWVPMHNKHFDSDHGFFVA